MTSRQRLYRLIVTSGLCGLLSLAVVVCASTLPGSAQMAIPQSGDAIPKVVLDGLARAGLSSPTNLRQRGPNYTANAITRSGAAAKVVISGTNGAIVGFRLIVPNDDKYGPTGGQ